MTQTFKVGDRVKLTGKDWDTEFFKGTIQTISDHTCGDLPLFFGEDGGEYIVCQGDNVDYSVTLVNEPLQADDLIQLTGEYWEDRVICSPLNFIRHAPEYEPLQGRQYHVRLDEDGIFYFFDEDGRRWDDLASMPDEFKVIKQGDTMHPDRDEDETFEDLLNEELDDGEFTKADGMLDVLTRVHTALEDEDTDPHVLRAFIAGACVALGYPLAE